MELLAPAGSKESFIAALRGGADAVYLGIQGHNARLYAKNFSFYDLEALIAYAHERKKKVFVTFNTLVKQWEIDDAAASLAVLERLGPDAVIVQDMGVARIVREYFPGLTLHASTQMAVHNGPGAAQLAASGIRRVVLARELSFSELKLIAAKSPVELEVFCHGALCFCVSGMCLFSSAIGGHSGNRGRCTQPCRRLWKGDSERGYLFSPRDLQLAEHLPKLRSLGITSLKIEGRMRSSDYVYRVVKAYRTLLDADASRAGDALKEAGELLAVDYARAKSPALFSGRDPNLFSPTDTQCLGLRVGKTVASRKDRLAVEVTRPLEHGDRIRVSDPKTDSTAVLKVKEFERAGMRFDFPYSGPAFKPGTPVFLAGDAASDERDFAREATALFAAYGGSRYPEEEFPKTYAKLLANRWSRKDLRRERLWLRVDDPAWLPLLPLGEPDADLVISLNRDNIHAFLKAAERLPLPADRVFCELTPYIGQRDLPEFRRAVEVLADAGVSRWVLNNVGQFRLFKDPPAELIAGHFLYTWNAYAAAAWKEFGVSRFVTSWEDETLNIKEMCKLALRGHLIVYLYGYPPLSRSRFLSKDMCGGQLVEEKPGLRFRKVYESGSGIVLPENPVSLFTARKKLREFGVDTFGIDLSFMPPDRARWEDIRLGYLEEKNAAATVKFNFKRGVK